MEGGSVHNVKTTIFKVGKNVIGAIKLKLNKILMENLSIYWEKKLNKIINIKKKEIHNFVFHKLIKKVKMISFLRIRKILLKIIKRSN